VRIVSGENAGGDQGQGERPTVGEETRAVVRARIVQGAATALAENGFAATVDDIAAAAGVSRRTVFRHFATHDDVLGAAMAEILARYDRLVPGPPPPGAELETWLRETAATMHDLNARLMGQAFWDMNIERPGITPAERNRRRVTYATQIAHHAWRMAEGRGRPPSWVVDAFALQLSGFATNCLAGYPADKAGRVTARVLHCVLAAAVAEESGGRGRAAPPPAD
jgi:AcrR family transcriptional regulator